MVNPGINRMKSLFTGFLVFGLVASAMADDAELNEARRRWLRGNYDEARALYEGLPKEPAHHAAAAIGISRAWQSTGEYDKALAAVEDALKEMAANAPLHARRAELLFLRGRSDDAGKAATRALELDKDNLPAHWVQAQRYRDRGDLKKADAEFRWFVRTYSARSDANKDIKDPDELLLVGLAGTENARWNNLADQFQFIVTEVYGDALKADKDFWPAECQAGLLLLEKYNRGEALAAFDKALEINPNAAEVYVGKGNAALQKYEIKDAERLAERALNINPNLVEARSLRADVYLAVNDVPKAIEQLDRAHKINARDEAVLGRLAVCLFLQRKTDDFTKLLQEIEKHNPKPARFYLVLGEQLDDRRRFDEAEKYLKRSAELWPMVPAAQNSLGLLYMRMGRENEARPILDKAFQADSFNVRVANTLKVLRHLDKYETLKTPHFELRFDPKTDNHLAKYMAKYLEEIQADLAKKFAYELTGPILVEVFNNHDMFSGRTIGLPDLHTIGACSGRMVAMVSPRAKEIRKPFNWARVIRHELVHIFNLEQTHFQVPHWFTEGLAVINEGFPRPQEWNDLLERTPASELMNLDTIDLGFIRPRSPSEWHLAYCQSQLYVEYMTKKFGRDSVGGMLKAYRDGLDTAEALKKVCNVDPSKFEDGYREHLIAVVRSLKTKPAAKPLSLAQLQEAHEKNPDDPEVSGQLAEQYLARRRNTDARKLAEEVLAKKPGQPLACYVKARLLMAAGDEDGARAVLETAKDSMEPKVLQTLGRMYYDAKEFSKAAAAFEQGRKAEPYESKWLTELVRVYAQEGNKDKQMAALKELVATDGDDLDGRRRLARMLVHTARYAEGERYARQALEIDVLDVESQRALGDALMGQNKYEKAIEPYLLVLEFDDNADAARLRLAEAYLKTGSKEKARAELAKVLVRHPGDAEATRLQRMLDN
jgi:tetratricopeptide (TPR) repeat protein